MPSPVTGGRPRHDLPKGFVDLPSPEVLRLRSLVAAVEAVHDPAGYEPLETPIVEDAAALGNDLPDVDRPGGGGTFVLRGEGRPLALRHDLTAPLARYLAARSDGVVPPLRVRRSGWRRSSPPPAARRGPVLVVPLGTGNATRAVRVARALRDAGVRTADRTGRPGVGRALRHADRCDAPLAVLVGGDEGDRGAVSVKDLDEGRRAAADIDTSDEWRSARSGQSEVRLEDLVSFVSASVSAVRDTTASTAFAHTA